MPSTIQEVNLLSELFHQSRQFKSGEEYLEFLDFVGMFYFLIRGSKLSLCSGKVRKRK